MEIRIDSAEIEAAVGRALADALGDHIDTTRPLAVDEATAAELLGLAPHQLRDLRRVGQIVGRKAGRSYRYSKKMLLDFLHSTEAE